MATPSKEEEFKELPVTFQPPLYLERRGWAFEILRREGVCTVLDVGCGEGSLISCLCNPAPWLPPPAEGIPDSLSMAGVSVDYNTISSLAYQQVQAEGFLHPTNVHGLDLSATDLQYAVEATAPKALLADISSLSSIRWEPLEVKIWQGGLESVNPEFVGVECIVSTEVIEHLPDDVLQDFAPILLGVYHPRLLLITTPSYTFNARFTAPDAPATARRGFPDPTGRTSRIFRHHDHKFEWTVEEFTDWCQTIADEWEYDVEVGGVGRPVEKDEWDRDEKLGYASQVAAFRRREGSDFAERRNQRRGQTARLKEADKRERHKLLANHAHTAHERARQPKPLAEIGELIRDRITRYREPAMRIADLWFEEQIAVACGGWIEIFLKAVDEHPELQIRETTSNVFSDWDVELSGQTLEQQELLWQKRMQFEDADNSTLSAGWFEEPQPVPAALESSVVAELEGAKSDWGDPDDDVSSLTVEVASQWSVSLPEGWSATEENNEWGNGDDWTETGTVLAVDAEANWE